MNFTSTKAPLWSIFPFIFEQWNNHYVSNKRKTSLKLSLSPDANHYPIGPIGGLEDDDALEVVSALDKTSIDLIDISGGTYFPGAKSASDSSGSGPYFTDFALRARARTAKPLMVTGGFKTRDQSVDALNSNSADLIGLARWC